MLKLYDGAGRRITGLLEGWTRPWLISESVQENLGRSSPNIPARGDVGMHNDQEFERSYFSKKYKFKQDTLAVGYRRNIQTNLVACFASPSHPNGHRQWSHESSFPDLIIC